MMTDSVADMLTRMRNASRIERPVVDMPATKLKCMIAQVLKDEGYIVDFQLGKMAIDAAGHKEFQADANVNMGDAHVILRVYMKYGPDGERVFLNIDRASRPGRRLYRRATQLKPVLDGLGIAILSTSRGVMSDRQARAKNLGGELLCTVW
jgi:small subunit ribosomal protein S8